MKRPRIVMAVALGCLLLCSPLVGEGGKASKIVGTYVSCPFACLAIRINADHTFDSYLAGDLFPETRVGGTWKFTGPDRILANSNEQPKTDPRVEEKATGLKSSFSIIALDPTTAVVPGVRITGIAAGAPFEKETGNDGRAIIPQCEEFWISFPNFPWLKKSWQHKRKNPGASEFLITLSEDQMSPDSFITNEIWIIRDGKLYFALEDGTPGQFPLEKVSRKRGRIYFPK